MTAPSLRFERALLREISDDRRTPVLAAIDEVGRGALAGPVAVGVVLIDASCRAAPHGVRDSKLCPPGEREMLAPRVRRWAKGCAVGMASAEEIDAIGLTAALALSASRALNALGEPPDVILLDGSHNYLSRSCPGVRVSTRVSADRTCAAVAAASIIAKVARDRLMEELGRAAPGYGWQSNRGYAAPEHLDALRRHGPTPWHRRSWNLPGIS